MLYLRIPPVTGKGNSWKLNGLFNSFVCFFSSTFCSTNWASRAYMEISGSDPELTICKIAVLPIKLYPLLSTKLYTHIFYTSNYKSMVTLFYKNKFTWGVTRTPTRLPQKSLSFHCLPIPALRQFRAKVTWTLISTVMSSMLYRLSYNPLY